MSRVFDRQFDPLFTQHSELSSSNNNVGLQRNVLGHNRPLFFKRPLVPHLPQMEVALPSTAPVSLPPINKHNTVAIQTDFRESEAQTDPYTPDYIVKPGAKPEVLTLESLKYPESLPARMPQVEAIELARKKRAQNQILSTLSLSERKKRMEEQELEDWNKREAEIDKLHNHRLNLIAVALKARESKMSELQQVRLDQLRVVKQAAKDRALDDIQRRRIKTLRVLNKKTREKENIQEFNPNNYTGLKMDEIDSLQTLSGLESLTAQIPASLLNVTYSIPFVPVTSNLLVNSSAGSFFNRTGTFQAITPNSLTATANSTAIKDNTKKINAYKQLESMVRPSTPNSSTPFDNEVHALILLQALIRGRAQQNLMFEGMMKRKALITQLRCEEQVLGSRKFHDSSVDFISGLIISETLDMISKSLVHANEEAELRSIMEAAEKSRWNREVIESGRRQKEFVRLHAVKFKEDKLAEDLLVKENEESDARKQREEIRSQQILIANLYTEKLLEDQKRLSISILQSQRKLIDEEILRHSQDHLEIESEATEVVLDLVNRIDATIEASDLLASVISEVNEKVDEYLETGYPPVKGSSVLEEDAVNPVVNIVQAPEIEET